MAVPPVVCIGVEVLRDDDENIVVRGALPVEVRRGGVYRLIIPTSAFRGGAGAGAGAGAGSGTCNAVARLLYQGATASVFAPTDEDTYHLVERLSAVRDAANAHPPSLSAAPDEAPEAVEVEVEVEPEPDETEADETEAEVEPETAEADDAEADDAEVEPETADAEPPSESEVEARMAAAGSAGVPLRAVPLPGGLAGALRGSRGGRRRSVRTHWAGNLYDSRLEARHAAFYSACGVPTVWREPYKFHLPQLTDNKTSTYTPDLLLENVWVQLGDAEPERMHVIMEIKPVYPNFDALLRMHYISRVVPGWPCILMYGMEFAPSLDASVGRKDSDRHVQQRAIRGRMYLGGRQCPGDVVYSVHEDGSLLLLLHEDIVALAAAMKNPALLRLMGEFRGGRLPAPEFEFRRGTA